MRATTPPPAGAPEPPADPRPAWERIAYTWLAREVDAGQPTTAEQLAQATSVTLAYAHDLLRVLRAHRQRDPGLSELRARLVQDRLTDAYLRRELAGGQRLDPAALAAELGTTATVARQWLHTLRAQHASEQGRDALGEPASRGEPSTAQLAGLAAHFAQGGHQHASVTGRPDSAAQVAAEVERAYWTREARADERLHALRLAGEFGAEPHIIAQQLRELRAGPATARERIEQLWQAHQADPGSRPFSSSQLAHRLGVTDAYVRHVTWQLRTGTGIAPLAGRLAASREQLTTPPRPAVPVDGERDWRQDAACRDADPELFSPTKASFPRPPGPRKSAPAARSAGPAWTPRSTGPCAGTTATASSPAPPPATAPGCGAGPPWPRALGSSRIGPRPSRRGRWPTRSASTAPPASWACPRRRCAGRSTTTAWASRRRSRAARPAPGSSPTATPPRRRGGARPRSASTRPARSWAPPTRRCAPPGSGTGLGCPPAPPP
jgi:hypothetical protein